MLGNKTVCVMDPRTTELERAFQLAMSGDCRSVDEIRKKLSQEGYYATQITGKSLLRQLQGLIAGGLDAGVKRRPSPGRTVERPAGERSGHGAISVDRLDASNDG
jgi:hypothetical protein